jgi:hypothetical protein
VKRHGFAWILTGNRIAEFFGVRRSDVLVDFFGDIRLGTTSVLEEQIVIVGDQHLVESQPSG